jgi:hypothetical protein
MTAGAAAQLSRSCRHSNGRGRHPAVRTAGPGTLRRAAKPHPAVLLDVA